MCRIRRSYGRARFASRGGGPNKNIGFPRGGVVPPRDLRGLSRGGVGLTPQEAEEGQTPQKLRLERGKEANDSQFPLESHFFTTNFMNKKIKKTLMKNLNTSKSPIFSSFWHILRKF